MQGTSLHCCPIAIFPSTPSFHFHPFGASAQCCPTSTSSLSPCSSGQAVGRIPSETGSRCQIVEGDPPGVSTTFPFHGAFCLARKTGSFLLQVAWSLGGRWPDGERPLTHPSPYLSAPELLAQAHQKKIQVPVIRSRNQIRMRDTPRLSRVQAKGGIQRKNGQLPALETCVESLVPSRVTLALYSLSPCSILFLGPPFPLSSSPPPGCERERERDKKTHICPHRESIFHLDDFCSRVPPGNQRAQSHSLKQRRRRHTLSLPLPRVNTFGVKGRETCLQAIPSFIKEPVICSITHFPFGSPPWIPLQVVSHIGNSPAVDS